MFEKIMGGILGWLSRWVDFRSKESRWEFTAVTFGLALFLLALPIGGTIMWLQYVFWGLGFLVLLFVGVLVTYYRRHPVEDKTQKTLDDIKKELHNLVKEIRRDRNERGKSK